jgi:inosose dehydratase
MTLLDRLAGAPISWGVCEVPGWGLELPPERVLSEMQALGLVGTELGSPGYLPSDPVELAEFVGRFDLAFIGGFVPLVLHDPSRADATIAAAHRAAALMGAAGATEFITAMVASFDWAPRFELDDAGWAHATQMLAVIEDIVAEYGMAQAIHPHIGTMIEQPADVRQVLDRSDVGWTFDMGHLMIGGYDPLEFLADARDKIRHVHLKETVLEIARPVFAGEQTIMQGVQNGMFCPMGRGDVPIGEIVTSLERSGYDRWYVLEQDAALTTGEPPEGEGPILDVQMSVDYLRGIGSALQTSAEAS